MSWSGTLRVAALVLFEIALVLVDDHWLHLSDLVSAIVLGAGIGLGMRGFAWV